MVRRNNATHLVLKNQMLEKKQDKNKIVLYIQIIAPLLLIARFLIYIYNRGKFDFLGVSNMIISYDETIELYETALIAFFIAIICMAFYGMYMFINLKFNKCKSKKGQYAITLFLLYAVCFFNNYFYQIEYINVDKSNLPQVFVLASTYFFIVIFWISILCLIRWNLIKKRNGHYFATSIISSLVLSIIFAIYLLSITKCNFYDLGNLKGIYEVGISIFILMPILCLAIELLELEKFVADVREIKMIYKSMHNSKMIRIGFLILGIIIIAYFIAMDYIISKSNIENDKDLMYISNIELNEINTFTNKVEKGDVMVCVLLEGNTEYLLAPCIPEDDELIVMKDDIFPYSKEGLTIKRAYLKKNKVFREESILKK